MRTPPSDLQYSWRLDGGPWSRFTPDDRILLAGLSSGRHTFEARSMDREFNIDPDPVVHSFVTLAPVWQRPWFIALSVALLAALSVSVVKWRTAQARLIEELESELQQARDMQMGLLPKGTHREGDFEIAGMCAPANHVGGDYFTHYWLDEEQRILAFGAADVSGKAMEAAVRVMQLSGIFRYEFREGREPLEVARGLDTVLKQQLDPATFVTCCLGALDTKTGEVHLVNAAHPFPYHYCADTGDLRALEMPSLPLGLVLPPGSPGGHCEERLKLSPGDMLVLYSDGVTDMQNGRDEFYEEHRLEVVINRYASQRAQGVVNAVVDDLRRFQGRTSQPDDITLLALRRAPEV